MVTSEPVSDKWLNALDIKLALMAIEPNVALDEDDDDNNMRNKVFKILYHKLDMLVSIVDQFSNISQSVYFTAILDSWEKKLFTKQQHVQSLVESFLNFKTIVEATISEKFSDLNKYFIDDVRC
ncbi:hypothetical protein L2E82_17020 [Cichorium intybus]|uniref:Uncharacterized protein n=1 Tax=Cichorium intybus TaxID=13427 RepID=A0ACB9F7S8_CICIN|nr:hypothetical protein L2E82_17020 [Cichorium intybus]